MTKYKRLIKKQAKRREEQAKRREEQAREDRKALQEDIRKTIYNLNTNFTSNEQYSTPLNQKGQEVIEIESNTPKYNRFFSFITNNLKNKLNNNRNLYLQKFKKREAIREKNFENLFKTIKKLKQEQAIANFKLDIETNAPIKYSVTENAFANDIEISLQKAIQEDRDYNLGKAMQNDIERQNIKRRISTEFESYNINGVDYEGITFKEAIDDFGLEEVISNTKKGSNYVERVIKNFKNNIIKTKFGYEYKMNFEALNVDTDLFFIPMYLENALNSFVDVPNEETKKSINLAINTAKRNGYNKLAELIEDTTITDENAKKLVELTNVFGNINSSYDEIVNIKGLQNSLIKLYLKNIEKGELELDYVSKLMEDILKPLKEDSISLEQFEQYNESMGLILFDAATNSDLNDEPDGKLNDGELNMIINYDHMMKSQYSLIINSILTQKGIPDSFAPFVESNIPEITATNPEGFSEFIERKWNEKLVREAWQSYY